MTKPGRQSWSANLSGFVILSSWRLSQTWWTTLGCLYSLSCHGKDNVAHLVEQDVLTPLPFSSVQEPGQCLQQGQGSDVQVIDKAFSLLSCGTCWRRIASCSLFIVHCTFIYLIYIYLIYFNLSLISVDMHSYNKRKEDLKEYFDFSLNRK